MEFKQVYRPVKWCCFKMEEVFREGRIRISPKSDDNEVILVHIPVSDRTGSVILKYCPFCGERVV